MKRKNECIYYILYTFCINLAKKHCFFGFPESAKHGGKEVRFKTPIEVKKNTKNILYPSCWSTFVNKQRCT